MTAVEDPAARVNPEAAWAWVQALIADIAPERSPENIARRFYEWDFAVRQFRRIEFNTFLDGRPSVNVLQQHERSLHQLIAGGKEIHADYLKFGSADLQILQITA